MCFSLDSVPTLGIPLFQEGLTVYSAKIRRHLSGIIRDTDAHSPNDLAEVKQFDIPAVWET